jgi:hypothetical protein
MIGNYFLNYTKEGMVSDIYSAKCDYPSVEPAKKNETDENVDDGTGKYSDSTIPILINYIKQLNIIYDKFETINSALSIGTIEVINPNAKPIVIATPPIGNNIKQKLNFIIPKGKKGKRGNKPVLKINGPNGKRGLMGDKGPDGIYATIEQQL